MFVLSYPALVLGHLLALAGAAAWGAKLGGHALLLVPTVLILGAGFGIVLGSEGLQLLPLARPMIWISTVVLIVAGTTGARLPLDETVGVASLFGILHGQALGAELGSAALP